MPPVKFSRAIYRCVVANGLVDALSLQWPARNFAAFDAVARTVVFQRTQHSPPMSADERERGELVEALRLQFGINVRVLTRADVRNRLNVGVEARDVCLLEDDGGYLAMPSVRLDAYDGALVALPSAINGMSAEAEDASVAAQLDAATDALVELARRTSGMASIRGQIECDTAKAAADVARVAKEHDAVRERLRVALVDAETLCASVKAAEADRAAAERLLDAQRRRASKARADAAVAAAEADEAEGRRIEAEMGRLEAEGRREEAEGRRDEAEGRRDEAEGRREEAERGRIEAEMGRDDAEGRREEAERDRDEAATCASDAIAARDAQRRLCDAARLDAIASKKATAAWMASLVPFVK